MSRPAPQPIALPGIHERFLPFLLDLVGARDRGAVRVLDAGAGEGALSRTLKDAGFSVAACDLLPERFACPDVEFRRADVTDRLPYDGASFDVVVAVELFGAAGIDDVTHALAMQKGASTRSAARSWDGSSTSKRLRRSTPCLRRIGRTKTPASG